MTDILARIDQATTEPTRTCWQCQSGLGQSVSDDFCSEQCQTVWHHQRTDTGDLYRKPDLVYIDFTVHPSVDHFAAGLTRVGDGFRSLAAMLQSEVTVTIERSTLPGSLKVSVSDGHDEITQHVPIEMQDDPLAMEMFTEHLGRLLRRRRSEREARARAVDNPEVELWGGPNHGQRIILNQLPHPETITLPVLVLPGVGPLWGMNEQIATARYRRELVSEDHWVYVHNEPAITDG